MSRKTPSAPAACPHMTGVGYIAGAEGSQGSVSANLKILLNGRPGVSVILSFRSIIRSLFLNESRWLPQGSE